MATEKGPQFYFNLSDTAETDLADWFKEQPRGRKSIAAIETLIAGRALSKVCQPIADLFIASARRGEVLTLDKVEDYIALFKTHSPEIAKPAPVKSVVVETVRPAVVAQPVIKHNPVEPVKESGHGFGDIGQ